MFLSSYYLDKNLRQLGKLYLIDCFYIKIINEFIDVCSIIINFFFYE